MSHNQPHHFSNKFKLDMNRQPTRSSDRTSLRFVRPGLVFGVLLMFIGAFELFNGFRHVKTDFDTLIAEGDIVEYQPLVSPVFFDVVFILIGLGMVAAAILSYLRYRKIGYDGKNITIVNRSGWGNKNTIVENIKNYQGVRLRIDMVQLGLMTSNRYIVELYHKDPAKIIPLYISLSGSNVRRIWEEYARAFKLPALINTDEGLVSRDVKNLNKSVKTLAELGYVIDNYDSFEPLPDNIAYARKKDKIVLKVRKVIWDAYNILAWIAIFIIGTAVLIGAFNFEQMRPKLVTPGFMALQLAALGIIIAAVFVLFRKEKLVIKKHKIVHTHKYMLFSTKHDEIPKDKIEMVDVTENPVTGRYFVSLISDDKTITFGRKLPKEDLRWVKKFLIHMIIR